MPCLSGEACDRLRDMAQNSALSAAGIGAVGALGLDATIAPLDHELGVAVLPALGGPGFFRQLLRDNAGRPGDGSRQRARDRPAACRRTKPPGGGPRVSVARRIR